MLQEPGIVGGSVGEIWIRVGKRLYECDDELMLFQLPAEVLVSV